MVWTNIFIVSLDRFYKMIYQPTVQLFHKKISTNKLHRTAIRMRLVIRSNYLFKLFFKIPNIPGYPTTANTASFFHTEGKNFIRLRFNIFDYEI